MKKIQVLFVALVVSCFWLCLLASCYYQHWMALVEAGGITALVVLLTTTRKFNEIDRAKIIFACGTLAFLGSTCHFYNYPGSVWIINNRLIPRGSNFGIPYWDTIDNLSLNKHDKFISRLTATTADGVAIEAFVQANVTLDYESHKLMDMWRYFQRTGQINAHVVIHDRLEELLKREFQRAVAHHTIDELDPKRLRLAWETGSSISDAELAALKIRWSGTITVTDISVTFASVPGLPHAPKDS